MAGADARSVEYRIATRDPLVYKQESLANCFELFAALAAVEDPAQVDDHLAAFEAALFNTRSSLQEQAAVSMRAVSEATFLRDRDSATTAAREAAVGEIERLKGELKAAQVERGQKAEREALARVIAAMPDRSALMGRAEAAKAAIASARAKLEAAESVVSRRRAQFSSLLASLRDLTEVLDEEAAEEAALEGVHSSGPATDERDADDGGAASKTAEMEEDREEGEA